MRVERRRRDLRVLSGVLIWKVTPSKSEMT